MTAYWEVNLSYPQAMEYVVLARICVLAIMIHCVTITPARAKIWTLYNGKNRAKLWALYNGKNLSKCWQNFLRLSM